VIAVDTSVVVAGFASWHVGHKPALAALARGPRVPAHVLLEAYSVLTRLPPPHRAPADVVSAFLRERFGEAPLSLPPRAYLELVVSMAGAGLTGGAIYDALIASCARNAGATLLTRDERALPVYERVGVRYELVGV
jgi:predicted nucleic acid-binding protein